MPDLRRHLGAEPAHLTGVVQRQDVVVIEPGGDRDLAQEPVGADHRRELGSEHLDRHLAVVFHVVGEGDGRHAAAAELALDGVAGCQGSVEALELLGAHGRPSFQTPT
ncbi:MAG TPA: hypothetical protein VJN39_10105 [Gemmatimonadales bacterium]|nr:hypothetical protein [Gemmatimonadales bacterium]